MKIKLSEHMARLIESRMARAETIRAAAERDAQDAADLIKTIILDSGEKPEENTIRYAIVRDADGPQLISVIDPS